MERIVVHGRRHFGGNHFAGVGGVQQQAIAAHRHIRQFRSQLAIHREAGFQRRSVGRRRTNLNGVFALVIDIVSRVFVPEVAVGQIQIQRDRFLFAGFQRHFVKRFQLFQRTIHAIRVRGFQIQLHDLFAIHRAGVLHIHAHLEGVVGGRRGFVHGHIAVLIGGIAHTVAKGIGLRTGVVLIGPAGVIVIATDIVIVDGFQRTVFRIPGHRQLGVGVDLAIQHAGDGVALRLTVVAGPQDRRHVVHKLAQFDHAHRLQIDDGVGIQLCHRVGQRHLVRGHHDGGTVGTFTGGVALQAHHNRLRFFNAGFVSRREGHFLRQRREGQIQIFFGVTAQVADLAGHFFIGLPAAGFGGVHRGELHTADRIHAHGNVAGQRRIVGRQLKGDLGGVGDVHFFEHQRRARRDITDVAFAGFVVAALHLFGILGIQFHRGAVSLGKRDALQIADVLAVRGAGAAFNIGHMRTQIFHTLNRSGGVRLGRAAGITAQLHRVGDVAHHHDIILRARIQRQNGFGIGGFGFVVFQQHDTVVRRILRQLFVRGGFHRVIEAVFRIVAIRHIFLRVELAGLHPRGEDAQQLQIDQIFGNHAVFHSAFGVVRINAAAVDVAASRQRIADRLLDRHRATQFLRCPLVVAGDILDRAAVGHHISLEPEGFAQQGIQQVGIGGCRDAVDPVVRAHNRSDIHILDDRFERTGVILAQGAVIHIGGAGVAVVFAVVCRIVLDGGNNLQIFFVIALQALDKAGADLTGQIRVFTVRLMVTTPARVTRHVDGGRKIGQTPPGAVGIAARLVRDRVGDLFDHRRIPARRHGDGIREGCRLAQPRYAMQTLGPKIVFGNAQPRNCGIVGAHLADFFFQRHAGYQVCRALFKRQRSIHIGQRGGFRLRLRRRNRKRDTAHGQHSGSSHRQHAFSQMYVALHTLSPPFFFLTPVKPGIHAFSIPNFPFSFQSIGNKKQSFFEPSTGDKLRRKHCILCGKCV